MNARILLEKRSHKANNWTFCGMLQQKGTVQQRQSKSSWRPYHLFWSTLPDAGREYTPAVQPLLMILHRWRTRAGMQRARQTWGEGSSGRWDLSKHVPPQYLQKSQEGATEPSDVRKKAQPSLAFWIGPPSSNGHIPSFSLLQGLPNPAYLPSSNTGCNSLSNFNKRYFWEWKTLLTVSLL